MSQLENRAGDDQRVPASAAALAGGGLIPFAAGAVGLWFADPAGFDAIANALVAYGAVILSFMGAIHWGVSLTLRPSPSGIRFAQSVIPALMGWAATLVPLVVALPTLIVGFILVFAWDLGAVRDGLVPPWYRTMRTVLTAAVSILLLIALGAAAV
ncbi:MAG: DUF3429 domain-containing protein [Pseudomonadota bacterium]